MRAFGKIAFIFGLAGIPGSVKAVDLVNRDRVDRETVINRSDGQSEAITLKPGQRIADICSACVILVGETSVETSGRTVVVIAGGKATVAK